MKEIHIQRSHVKEAILNTIDLLLRYTSTIKFTTEVLVMHKAD